jgi:hypothetical protein
LASGSRPARRVDDLLDDPRLRDQPWQRFRVKDGEKGPMVWECKHVMLTVKGADGLPGEALHLLVARDVLDPGEVKFFVSNAPAGTGVGALLLVACSRWRVERCFEDQKGEIGLDQYEGRRYLGLKRHLIVSAVSYLFLARAREELRGEKPGTDGLPAAHGGGGAGALLGAVVGPIEGGAAGQGGAEDHLGGAPERPGSEEPREADPAAVARARHQAHRTETMPVGHNLVHFGVIDPMVTSAVAFHRSNGTAWPSSGCSSR